VISVGQATIQLPDGMIYFPETVWTGNPYPGRAASALIYSDKTGRSSAYFYADTGEIIQQEIIPEHEAVFAEILRALDAATP
jgi:hypothetical protein